MSIENPIIVSVNLRNLHKFLKIYIDENGREAPIRILELTGTFMRELGRNIRKTDKVEGDRWLKEGGKVQDLARKIFPNF